MAKTTEEVQMMALQEAAARHGVTWHPGYGGSRMTPGMKYVIARARERGLIIEEQGKLSKQVIEALSEILVETAIAYATVGSSLLAINKEVHGSPIEGAVVKFNRELQEIFGQHLLTLNRGTTGTMFRQLEPIEIVETQRTWIQRLLLVED